MSTRVVCFRLTREEYRTLQVRAAELGSPLASLFRDAITEYLEQACVAPVGFATRTAPRCNTPTIREP